MPFSTDNSWPAGLLKIFETCCDSDKNKPLENHYYGPYDKLLNYCFEDSDSLTFFVAPQNPLHDHATWDALGDFRFFLIVFNADHRPVLMAEIKDDSWASRASLRLEADQLLRRQYSTMLDTCPLPRLWGLSFLGTSVRIYCGDVATRSITPPYQAHSREDYLPPQGYLEGEWNLDILSQEGFNKMKEIIADITTSADSES